MKKDNFENMVRVLANLQPEEDYSNPRQLEQVKDALHKVWTIDADDLRKIEEDAVELRKNDAGPVIRKRVNDYDVDRGYFNNRDAETVFRNLKINPDEILEKAKKQKVSILEVGPGKGAVADYLKENYTGGVINFFNPLKNKFNTGLVYHAVGLTDPLNSNIDRFYSFPIDIFIPDLDQKYDYIISMDGICYGHIQEPILNTLMKSLKVGGEMFFNTKAGDNEYPVKDGVKRELGIDLSSNSIFKFPEHLQEFGENDYALETRVCININGHTVKIKKYNDDAEFTNIEAKRLIVVYTDRMEENRRSETCPLYNRVHQIKFGKPDDFYYSEFWDKNILNMYE